MVAARPKTRTSHHLTVQRVHFVNQGNRTYVVWPYMEERIQGENIEPLQLGVQLYVLLISLKCDAGIIYYILLYSTYTYTTLGIIV